MAECEFPIQNEHKPNINATNGFDS